MGNLVKKNPSYLEFEVSALEFEVSALEFEVTGPEFRGDLNSGLGQLALTGYICSLAKYNGFCFSENIQSYCKTEAIKITILIYSDL